MKYIIIKPNCRELSNHLWNYLSIYACGLETGASVYNPSFFEWHHYFNLSGKELFITKLFSALRWLAPVWRTFGTIYGSYLVRTRAICARLTLGVLSYLQPTKKFVDANTCETIYFIGWLFRNPVGLARHRDALVTAFTPKKSVLDDVDAALAPLRGKKMVGIKLRQQPFRGFEDGPFLVPLQRVRQIIDEYMHEKKLSKTDVALVLVSDAPVNRNVFMDLTTHISRESDITNLFLLSKCDVVIGDNSTFSNLAAWFGNVPHIVTTNEPIDWEYYKNRPDYFENKYATFAH